jgi:outer membrane protein assembly factor BamB
MRTALQEARVRKTHLAAVVLGVGALAGASGADAAGDEWPQWRGPARDGRVAGLAARASWPEALTPGWKLTVGAGHSSPVVAAGRVYQLSREGEDEVVRALELGTGKVVWRQAYPAAYQMSPAATGHGKGPKATPVLADGRLFTLGISGILSAWDAASGRLLWRKSFETSHRATSPLYGAAMSPVVDGGRVIAHVGGHDDGALVALDAATGTPPGRGRATAPVMPPPSSRRSAACGSWSRRPRARSSAWRPTRARCCGASRCGRRGTRTP